MKRMLIVKASKSICGEEIGLMTHQAKLLGIEVREEQVDSPKQMELLFKKYDSLAEAFDYVYLCTHGDGDGFEIDNGLGQTIVSWNEFSEMMCLGGIFAEDTIILLACCRGGLFKVTSVIMACCYRIKFVCGVKWSVKAWDLTTGFIVFIYNMETKNAEPRYAAKKASKATDYTFECYDREEIESNPQFKIIKDELYEELGWKDEKGNWITDDVKVKENVGIDNFK